MYAGFWKRLGASCIDAMIVAIGFYVVMIPIILVTYGMAAITNNKQTLHDRISHTYVVDRK